MRVAGLFAALLLVLGATPGRADSVRLETGETIRGRVLNTLSNEEVLVIRDQATGALRRVRWERLAGTARVAYARAWGWLDPHRAPLDGVRLTVRQEDGSTQVRVGLREEGGEADSVRLRSEGTVLDIPRARIVDEVWTSVDPRSIWTAQQLRARLHESMTRAGVDPDRPSAAEALHAAHAAYWALDLEEAIRFAALARDGSGHARQLEEHGRALLAQGESLQLLRAALAHLRQGRLRQARAARDALLASYAALSPALREQLAELDAALADALTGLVSARVPTIAKRLIEEHVKHGKATLATSFRWAEHDLEWALFTVLAIELEPFTGAISPIELRLAWQDRSPVRRVRRATYGAGTLVVVPARVPIRESPASAAGGEDGPDARAWWGGATRRERVAFLLAVFAEGAAVFEVGGGQGAPCARCNGAGTLAGEDLCPRCGGARVDRVVQIR